MSDQAQDVIAYLDWWEFMLWRAQLMCDANGQWQRDLSFDEIAAMTGVPAPRLRPGDPVMNVDLAVALYWPGVPPNPDSRQAGSRLR